MKDEGISQRSYLFHSDHYVLVWDTTWSPKLSPPYHGAYQSAYHDSYNHLAKPLSVNRNWS